jgi:hypothetical protein
MPLEALQSIAFMSAAAIASWLLIDGFRSGRATGFRWNQTRDTHPGRFWASQGVTFLILGGSIYGLFKTLESMNA